MSEEFCRNVESSSSSGGSGGKSDRSKNNQSHVLEQSALNSYQPPGSNTLVFDDESTHDDDNNNNNKFTRLPSKAIQWVYNPSDGSVLRDPNGIPVSVDRLLATKPLRGELSTRPGPGNKKLTYLSGDGVARTLNDIFGYDGWNLDIGKVNREECLKDPKTGKYSVVYTAMVRVTHKASGAYREECGTGDAVDKHFGTAVGHALKGSITDAMKRAARHFGDKLGNSLYDSAFNITKAPTTLREALDRYDIERANTKFGFAKDHQKRTAATRSDVGCDLSAGPQTTVDTQTSGQVQPLGWQRNATRDSWTMNASANRILPQAKGLPSSRPSYQQVAMPESTVQQSHSFVNRPAGQPPIYSTTNSVALLGPAVITNHTSLPQVEQKRQDGPRHAMQADQSHSHDASSNHNPCLVRSAVMPPPTPGDSLRKSGIFAFQEDDDAAETLPRPISSYGKPGRSSLGESARPIQASPLVTPTAPGAYHKRPALESVGNLDPSQPKKAASSVLISQQQQQHNPYGKISRM